MPEVKWVQKYNLRDGPQPIETGPVTFVPVLTLDQLEAWLKAEVQRNESSLTCIGLKHVLSQAQAWKEGK